LRWHFACDNGASRIKVPGGHCKSVAQAELAVFAAQTGTPPANKWFGKRAAANSAPRFRGWIAPKNVKGLARPRVGQPFILTSGGAAKTTEDTMASKRELIDTGRDKRFVRRDEQGQFKESDDVGRSLSQDVRRKAKTVVKAGDGDKGDQRRKK
jgi:hypothetical protein